MTRFEQLKPFFKAKARIGSHQPDADIGGQALQNRKRESHHVVEGDRVAGSQPKANHQFGLGQKSNHRIETTFEAMWGVARPHPLALVGVLMHQLRGVQIQGVASRSADQPLETPLPHRIKGAQVHRCAIESSKETAQGGLTGHAFNVQQRRQGRVGPQISHLGQFFGSG